MTGLPLTIGTSQRHKRCMSLMSLMVKLRSADASETCSGRPLQSQRFRVEAFAQADAHEKHLHL